MIPGTKVPKDFNLEHIFECGQCFRWEKQDDGSYTGVAKGRIVNMRYDEPAATSASGCDGAHDEPQDESYSEPQDKSYGESHDRLPGTSASDGGQLTIFPCTQEEFTEIWTPYLDLKRDYGAIKKTLSENDEVMKKASDYGYGIRILNQDLWETIVSFIISQNNNIPRIKGCIERLCENFGEPIEPDKEAVEKGIIPDTFRYDIPAPEKLASLTIEDLAPVRLGYRARYLIETSKTVLEKGLPEGFDDLSSLCGVGPKVANCISLFGMQNYASFPIDVWVIKVMHELYGLDEHDKKGMAEFAKEKFGELGGFAQQYLFYYMRDRS